MARNTDLRVTIDGDAAKLERAVQRAARSMNQLEREIANGNREAAQLEQQLNQRTAAAIQHVGRGMLVAGAAIAAGLGLAVKAAIDWESAWAGVLKTVEGSPEQLAALERELRNIARTGFSHDEVAAVAEAAGQLGIQTPHIAEFTKTMLDLGVATNLTAEEAAFAIARISNIMGTAAEDTQRLGSTIVDLGNNSATTERDIVEMSLRIAGAGKVIGLTESDVLAFAAALSSVGVESQAGGTAISRVMSTIASAAAEGGDAVATFAEVAGMSAADFTRAFEDDPARAIAAFVAGLGDITESGGNVFAVLEELGFGEIRVRDALLRMAGAGDLLVDSLDRGASAWEQNTALIEEAQRRYDTAEVKIQAAKSTLVDLAIDVGSVLLPALVGLLEAGTDIVAFFADLPGPVQAVATIFAVLLGTAALLGGSFLLMAPKIAAARVEMQLLATTAPKVAGAMRLFTLSLPVIGVLLTAAAGIAAIAASSKEAAPPISEATKALLDLNQGVSNQLIQNMVDAAAAMQQLSDPTEHLLRIGGDSAGAMRKLGDATGEFERGISSLDTALAELVSGGNADQAEASFNALASALAEQGISVAELRRMMPEYAEALQEAENQTRLAAESVSPLDAALEDLAIRFGLTGDDAAKAAEQMLQSWSEAGGKFVDALGAYTDALASKEEDERKAAEATAEATEDATDSWEDYVSDVELTVDEYLAQLERMVKNQENWRDNLVRLAGRASDEMLGYLIELGPEGADLVALFASMTDKELQEAEGLWSRSTEGSVRTGIIDPVLDAGPVLERIARDHGQDVADEIRDYMIKHGVGVETAARKLGVKIDKGVRDGEERTIPIGLRGEREAISGIRNIGNEIDRLPSGKKITITASGDIRVGGGTALREHGGPVKAGEPYIVGEKRPELFVPDQDGRILPQVPPGMGGRISKVDIHAKNDIDATDFNRFVTGVATRVGNAAGAVPGKVLPPGSYRIGRGPAAHGYNARDLPAPIGTPVYAAASGVVSRAARLATSYGIHAAISHANWRSLYAHMSQMYVRAGQAVSRGQMIGRVGSTGNSTGPHLHLEPDNPRLYDRGGKWAHGTFGFNASGGTEYVLSPAQSRMFDRMISVMETGRRGGDGAAALDPAILERAVRRGTGEALNGSRLILDDRIRGHLVARIADLYGRSG